MYAIAQNTLGRTLAAGMAAAALLVCAALLPAAAHAAAPSNDAIDSATSIGALPYNDTLDTTEATTAADDPSCAGNGHTVWYRYTPSSSIRVDANTFGSSYDTTISVYTGSPGSLTQIACNDDAQGLQSQVTFDATAGQSYYVMAGSFGSGSGGTLTLELREAAPPPPAPEVGLTIDRAGHVDRNGVASVSATLTCNQPMFVGAYGTLTQKGPGRTTIQGFGGNNVSCTPPGVDVKIPMSAFGASPLRHGPGQANVSAFGCSIVTCAFDTEMADVVLRGGPGQ